MPGIEALAVLCVAALIASIIGGVAGFGTGVIMVPIVAWTVGVRAVAPVLTVSMFLANFSRLWWSRGEIDRAVVGRFLAGAIPATVLGAVFYAGAASTWLARVIGVFLLAAVPFRRLMMSGRFQPRLAHFPIVGAVFGLLSAIVVTTGPVVTPFFLAYGLRRGAYIGTEAVCAFAMHGVRGVVFARYALLTREAITLGALLGAIMFAGAWVARRALERMSDRVFLVIIEVLLVVTGLQFLLFVH